MAKKEIAPSWVTKSIVRWDKILADAKKGKVEFYNQPDIDVYGVCGYCDHFGGRTTSCESRCPLAPKYCTNFGFDSTALFWKICKELKRTKGKSNKQIIKMIEEMLKAVRTKWREKP